MHRKLKQPRRQPLLSCVQQRLRKSRARRHQLRRRRMSLQPPTTRSPMKRRSWLRLKHLSLKIRSSCCPSRNNARMLTPTSKSVSQHGSLRFRQCLKQLASSLLMVPGILSKTPTASHRSRRSVMRRANSSANVPRKCCAKQLPRDTAQSCPSWQPAWSSMHSPKSKRQLTRWSPCCSNNKRMKLQQMIIARLRSRRMRWTQPKPPLKRRARSKRLQASHLRLRRSLTRLPRPRLTLQICSWNCSALQRTASRKASSSRRLLLTNGQR
mmetsp:Transcript_145669/g.265264  ORF Transcript_145669/g.265264 Transcript_145669/m.265264 type:complete len:268 (-) Transcript_145669:594-1397(-)